ncbi:hypothetical protein FOCC_FOCC005572 [Frankliniella occidentalis]|nr:hypothetical protein FOCC_FOCC005572 [Frankliniella occidentalis]
MARWAAICLGATQCAWTARLPAVLVPVLGTTSCLRLRASAARNLPNKSFSQLSRLGPTLTSVGLVKFLK